MVFQGISSELARGLELAHALLYRVSVNSFKHRSTHTKPPKMPSSANHTKKVTIPAKTKILFDRVSQVQATQFRPILTSTCSTVPGVEEAFLLRCKLPNDGRFRVVAVLGVSEGHNLHDVASRVIEQLPNLPDGQDSLDVLPLKTSALPASVYILGDLIHGMR